ncbi:hypothetical protein EV667_1345 [Ancylobacter aquaticus]|uniref:Uncharacterized protein n=1 Tax=Ancylobacter aquaticus TaxID=100 RepID=A0A4R1ID64_ANCAQ|nr:hypothetical protein [Ancylobacter aquaticus]TCK31239.1 hypothetical protein EV667_1345 [Ancylobacter aquaticus]
MTDKLQALRARLLTAQRTLIVAAAEAGATPPDNALRKIGDIEVALAAVEAMIDEASKG